MRLQHNIMAKSSYRSYKNNVSGMKKSLERLASGYKVNRAADDAAGLAISEKLRAQIAGEETAQKNAKDGISLVQTAEGALAEVHDILDRMAELATQSANGTYDNDTDRYQLQKEMGLLLDEINRIADSSNFNGIPLLDGSMDAGGSTVFTPGSFQINNSTLHPAGLDAGSIELPDVGPTLGDDTVLHTEGTKGSDTNAFSIDLHNVILNANSTISISIGDGVSITVTNNSDEPVTAKDIAAAINGDSSKNISVDFGDAKVGMSEKGNVTVTLGQNSVFELKDSGTRVTFTQIDGGDIEMPKEVTIADSELSRPKVEEGADDLVFVETPESTSGNPISYNISLKGVNVSGPGWVTFEVFDRKFDLKITAEEFANRGTTSIGKVLTEKLVSALTDANFPADSAAGALTFTNNGDGTFTVGFTELNTPPADYSHDRIALTTSDYRDGGSGTMKVKMESSKPGDSSTQYQSVVTVELDKNTSFRFEVYGGTLPSGVEADDDNVIFVPQGKTFDYQMVADKMNQIFAKRNAEEREKNKNYDEYVNTRWSTDGVNYYIEYEYVKKQYIGISNNSGSGGGTGSGGGPGGPGTPVDTNVNFTGDYNKSTTVLQSRAESTQDRLASTYFNLSKLADADGYIAEGTSITIGRNTYTFTYDADKIGKDGYVVLNGGEDPDGLDVAAEKLTKAAEHNLTYTVGHDGTRITITEKEGQTYFDLTNMEGIEKSLGFKNANTTPASGAKGLTLQIGDTDDVYSQLKISIKDCHPRALGIDGVSIARQEDAAAAVNAIRAAVNYVSDVRGTLGAAQNRLDHTINNLAVMVENVQDSESSIRDADIAEEMMSYTKNNILIQSAQSMLAQANQIPQGVLQLLQ